MLNELLTAGKFDQALKKARELAQQHPLDSYFQEFIGLTLSEAGRHNEALSALEKAIEIDPKNERALSNKAIVQQRMGQFHHAIKTYSEIVAINPNHIKARVNAAKILHNLDQSSGALAIVTQAYEIAPDNADVLFTRGLLLHKLKKHTEALEHFSRKIELHGKDLETSSKLSLVHLELGNFEQALSLLQENLTVDPNHIDTLLIKAKACSNMGQIADAILTIDRILQIDPQNALANRSKGLQLLKSGNFEEGWKYYEWRLQSLQKKPSHSKNAARWNGEDINGKSIFLSAEQGLGDQIQFVRYAHALEQRGAKVIVECAKNLIPLLKSCPGVADAVERGSPPPDTDFHCPIISVAGVLEEKLSSPHHTPYLFAEGGLVEVWAKRLQKLDGFRVGINWQGNTDYQGDQWRSFPLAQFTKIAKLDHVQLVSLQKGEPGVSQIPDFLKKHELTDIEAMTENQSNLSDAAAVIMNLDLVVTSCTAMAHLAGSLGVPTWVVLGRAPDWRWLTDRNDTPWYPNTRLFRQQTLGNWDEVFYQVRDAMKLEIQQKLPRETNAHQ